MDPVFFLLPKDDENRALKPGAGYQNRFFNCFNRANSKMLK